METMNKLEERIIKNITRNFLERFISQIYSEDELDFFRSVCISYLRKELNINICNYLCKIFEKEKVIFINNIDYIINYEQDKDKSEKIIELRICDIYFIIIKNNLLVVYSYEIDKINSLVENILGNIKVSKTKKKALANPKIS